MDIEIKAPRRANGRVSDDAYFLGLCILATTRTTKDEYDALLREIQRIGRFEMKELPEE